MYGKVFRQMYSGSMSRQGWEAIVTMQQFIVMADRHGVVEMTLEAMSSETKIPLEVLQKGVEILSAPDPGSRTPDEDGRRIVLLDDRRDWGWQLVNYAKYRKIQSEEDRREYQRQYWHKRKKKTQHDSTDSIHAEAEAEAEGLPLRSSSVGTLSTSYSDRANGQDVLTKRPEAEKNKRQLRQSMAGAVKGIP
jgi:hypothetical protein